MFHLFRCSCLNSWWLLYPQQRGCQQFCQKGLHQSLPFVNLSASSFPCILWRPGTHTKVTLIDPHSFSSTCMFSHNKADSVVVFASAAIAVLLSKQIHILLLVTFLDKRSYVHLRITIISACKIVERLPIGILSLWLSLGAWTSASKQMLIPDLSTYQMLTLGSVILPGIHQSSLVSINTFILFYQLILTDKCVLKKSDYLKSYNLKPNFLVLSTLK